MSETKDTLSVRLELPGDLARDIRKEINDECDRRKVIKIKESDVYIDLLTEAVTARKKKRK